YPQVLHHSRRLADGTPAARASRRPVREVLQHRRQCLDGRPRLCRREADDVHRGERRRPEGESERVPRPLRGGGRGFGGRPRGRAAGDALVHSRVPQERLGARVQVAALIETSMTDTDRDIPGIVAPPPLIFGVPLVIGLLLDRWHPLPFLPPPLAPWIGI